MDLVVLHDALSRVLALRRSKAVSRCAANMLSFERLVMKKNLLRFIVLVVLTLISAPGVYAQGGAKNGPDPSTIRDPELEKDSLHNLEVARQYFKLKKAYVAALQRCEEIIAGNPTFAKIDEALFIAGESDLYLSQSKGKQRPSLYVRHDGAEKRSLTPEEFREEARGYLSQLVNNHPNSSFRKQAEEDLQLLGGVKPKTAENSKQ
jgi:hypothetical protein